MVIFKNERHMLCFTLGEGITLVIDQKVGHKKITGFIPNIINQ